jgi:phosphoglycolate phosphatase
MNRTHKLFLFDFDGVIVDSLDFYERRVKRCLDKIGNQIIHIRADFLELFEDNFYEAIVKKGVNLDLFLRTLNEIPTDGDGASLVPFAPVLPVLQKLHDKAPLIVISSNDSSVIDASLEKLGITDYFRDVLGSDFGLSKEKKIRHAMDLFQVEPQRTYYIGDTAGDIKEARLAGSKTVAVTWGWHTRETLEKVNPDYLLDSPELLMNFV